MKNVFWILCALCGAAPVAATAAPSVLTASVGLAEAVRMVQAQTGGRVLSAERTQDGGRAVWRVKVLLRNGDVQVFTVDAASGAMG